MVLPVVAAAAAPTLMQTIGPSLITGALGGLGSYFGAKGQDDTALKIAKENREWQDAKNRNAQGMLAGYGYNPYGQTYAPATTAYDSSFGNLLSMYLSGQLTPGQQATLANAGTTGMSRLNATSASNGLTVGGRLALTQQLNKSIADTGANMVSSNQQFGMGQYLPYLQNVQGQGEKTYTYGLADYLRGQDASNEKMKLMASYATGS